jgi:pyruvate kinase
MGELINMHYQDLATNPLTLLDCIVSLRKEVYEEGNETFKRWRPGINRKFFVSSAINLAFYLALRRKDIRDIQEALMPWGLSSLGRLESRTINNIDSVIASLRKIIGEDNVEINYPSHNSFVIGRWLLERNTKRIFGENPENRFSRIMVTLPPEAADDYKFVYALILRGMNVARINCAHDSEEVWKKMVHNIRKAEKELHKCCKVLMDIAGPKARIDILLTSLMNPKVNIGDVFFLTGDKMLQNYYGMEIACSCSIPEMIPFLKEGDPVLVDDGMIEGFVEKVYEEGIVVRVKKSLNCKGVRLKAQKGLNFPDSTIKIDVVTEKDKQDLDFICDNADIIGFSFVKDAEDIKVFQNEIIKRMGEERAHSVSIMAKIETAQGIDNLPEIIVAAAGKNPFCVMIARGDLAVEEGYLRLAELQEEIMWICEAANVPVIWATQVLENMIKSGIPSRAEITDAAMGGRAECVMLNKGDFLLDGLTALDDILIRMQAHQHKKTPRLRALSIAKER